MLLSTVTSSVVAACVHYRSTEEISGGLQARSPLLQVQEQRHTFEITQRDLSSLIT